MSTLWLVASVAAFSYLIGSIPFGVLAGRIAGVDLQRHGSGNIGATNALRVLGKKFGLAVFAADTLKGFLPVKAAMLLALRSRMTVDQTELLAVLAAVACILGHAFPVWLKFRGGKGVATSAGTLLALAPLAAILVATFWFVIFKVTRYVSVASVLAALILPAILFALLRLNRQHPGAVFWLSAMVGAIIIWRHRSNIQRLLNGTEPRFARK